MAGSMATGKRDAGEVAENYFDPQAGDRVQALTGSSMFWNLKAHPQWCTSSKVTHPNSCLPVPPIGDQVFKQLLTSMHSSYILMPS